MANDEHLFALRCGPDAWNVWRQSNPDVLPDLQGAHLHRANLSEADLRHADLGGADLSGADLTGADLRGANLRAANLSEAELYDADLRGADLRRADLRGAKVEGAWRDGGNKAATWQILMERGIALLQEADREGGASGGFDLGQGPRRLLASYDGAARKAELARDCFVLAYLLFIDPDNREYCLRARSISLGADLPSEWTDLRILSMCRNAFSLLDRAIAQDPDFRELRKSVPELTTLFPLEDKLRAYQEIRRAHRTRDLVRAKLAHAGANGIPEAGGCLAPSMLVALGLILTLVLASYSF